MAGVPVSSRDTKIKRSHQTHNCRSNDKSDGYVYGCSSTQVLLGSDEKPSGGEEEEL